MTPDTSRRQITEIVRMALDDGKTVEIEGLGTFQVAAHRDQGYRFEPQTAPQVFLAYVVEDLAPARRLCGALRAEGFSPWLDKEKLLPGQNWPRAIERAIDLSEFFIGCFSRRSVAKRGHFQCELEYALNVASRVPSEERSEERRVGKECRSRGLPEP